MQIEFRQFRRCNRTLFYPETLMNILNYDDSNKKKKRKLYKKLNVAELDNYSEC